MRKKIAAILALLSTLTAFSATAFAAENGIAELPFEVKNSSGTIILEAINNAPLPEITEFNNVKDGKFTIIYSEPENYQYKIYQKSENEEYVEYDEAIYTINISIFNGDDGLYTVTTINKDESTDKSDSIIFNNTINKPESSTPSTPESSTPSTPSKPDNPNPQPPTSSDTSSEPSTPPDNTSSEPNTSDNTSSKPNDSNSTQSPNTGVGLSTSLLAYSAMGLSAAIVARFKKKN